MLTIYVHIHVISGFMQKTFLQSFAKQICKSSNAKPDSRSK